MRLGEVVIRLWGMLVVPLSPSRTRKRWLYDQVAVDPLIARYHPLRRIAALPECGLSLDKIYRFVETRWARLKRVRFNGAADHALWIVFNAVPHHPLWVVVTDTTSSQLYAANTRKSDFFKRKCPHIKLEL